MIESHILNDWIETHCRLSVDSEAMHDNQSVAFGMLSKYDLMDHGVKKCIFPLLSNWLLSDDNCLRYDAAFIISQRKIRELIPGILNAIKKCSQTPGPESHYEAKKLKRILNELKC